jgi:hypothetical protein
MKDGRLNHCIECKREYSRGRCGTPEKLAAARRWNRKNMDKLSASAKLWAKNNPEKRRAHSALWRKILSGEIIRGKVCERCGIEPNTINAHHSDYTKPLEVMWLCVSCHRKEDKVRLATLGG